MMCDSRRCELCQKPGITLKMDEQMENVLTTVSVLALSYLKAGGLDDPAMPYENVCACMKNGLSSTSM